MSLQETYAVIMAGGGGTRLWPLSRVARPKQSLRLWGERTLFQLAVDRVVDLIPAERILVVTVEKQVALLREQVPSVPEGNFLREPAPRGTASVVGLAAMELRQRSANAVMVVLTADHLIQDTGAFHAALEFASRLAAEGELVTLGIKPYEPATGFGYIQLGEQRSKHGHLTSHQALSFTEKPSVRVAEQYVASGSYYWNSGMFVWKADRIWEEIGVHMPKLAASLEEIAEAEDKEEAIRRVWTRLENETIDYGVMEKAADVTVILADELGWMDVGGWDQIYELHTPEPSGNVLQARDVKSLETSGSLIYQNPEVHGRLIATVGVQDLVIVDTPDVLLVCHRDSAQLVRELVESLRSENSEKYL